MYQLYTASWVSLDIRYCLVLLVTTNWNKVQKYIRWEITVKVDWELRSVYLHTYLDLRNYEILSGRFIVLYMIAIRKKNPLFCTFCQEFFCYVVYKCCTRTKDNGCNPAQVFWTPTPAPWPGAAWPTTASWTWWPPSNGSQRTSPSSAAIRVRASRWWLLLYRRGHCKGRLISVAN